MKIVFFSRSIYPRSGGSSFVIENLAQNFKTGELLVIGEKQLGRKIDYKRAGEHIVAYLSTGISVNGRGARFFDFFRSLTFPFVLMKSVQLVRKHTCTHIVGVFPEGFYLLLALCTARITGLPFYAYFHNTFIENRSGWRKWWGSKIQNIVFSKARFIFVMSEGMKSFYNESYPGIEKFEVLPHTFVKYPEPAIAVRQPHTPYRLAFTGNFNDSNLEATIRVVNALRNDSRIQMNFYTPVSKSLLQLRGIDVNAICYKGYLKEEDYFTELRTNDIMILTHGFEGGFSDIEYRTIFPTRFIPMMLTQKPVFVHCPKSSFLHSFVSVNDCALLVDEKNEKLIKAAVLRLLENIELRNFYIDRANACVSQFYGPVVYKNFVDKLTQGQQMIKLRLID